MTKKFNVIINNELQNPPVVDFTVMGFGNYDNDFLNWCLKNKDNLEFLKEKMVLELACTNTTIYSNENRKIMRIDKTSVENRT